jgi:hypothetical protein
MTTKSILIAATTLLISFSAAEAQTFTSGALSLDGSNVENVGTVLEAVNFYRFDNNPVTINGVAFTNFQAQDPSGNVTSPQTGPHFSFNGGGVDGTGGGLAGASAGVSDLNSEGVYYGSTIQLTNLSIGTTYAAQFFLDADNSDYRTANLTDGAVTSATVTGGIPGPQFITDTFTATGTTESIVKGGGVLQLSGFVIESVPEPSTYAMMLGGLALLGFCVRRKLA